VRLLGWVIVRAAITLAIVCSLAATAFPSDPALPLSGKRLFELNCAVCHGTRGDGKGVAAGQFKTPPRDLTKGVYKFRSTDSGQLPSDADLTRTISFGIPGTAMVARGDLNEAEIHVLVEYVKSLSPRFNDHSSRRVLPVTIPPIRDRAALVAGQKIYQASGCSECHGSGARGDGPSAAKLAVKPSNLTQRPLKSGSTPKDIYRTILTGLDGTSMPSYHLVLAEENIWKLAYYVESLGRSQVVREDERKGREIVRRLKSAKENKLK